MAGGGGYGGGGGNWRHGLLEGEPLEPRGTGVVGEANLFEKNIVVWVEVGPAREETVTPADAEDTAAASEQLFAATDSILKK